MQIEKQAQSTNIMSKENLDWTHKEVTIKDIRKLYKLYVLNVCFNNNPATTENVTLFVKDNIFEDRLKSYFLTDDISNITREKILNVKWNMYATKGYYIKINDRGDAEKFMHDSDKWYVSYLEIAGPLGVFTSVYRDKEIKEKEQNR